MAPKNITLTALSGSLLAMSGPVLANNIDFAVGLESAYTDNANNTASNPVSERQDRLSLSAEGEYKNNWLTAELGYQISQLLFDKDTQDDRTELEGSASALFGKENGRFNFTIANSKRQVLGNAGELSVSDNYQTRDVTSLQPRLNIFQDQADTLSITGLYSAVNFDQNQSTQDSFDTTSTGAELAWRRNLSKVDSISLIAQHQEIEYDDLAGEDYEYQSVVLRYATELRQLSYSVALGYNVTDPDTGSEDSSLQWEVSVAYDSGGNQISLLSESYLTDPSRGNQNSLLEDGSNQVALGNGSTAITDQYNRRAHTLTYSTSQLCNLCTLTLTASYSTRALQCGVRAGQ